MITTEIALRILVIIAATLLGYSSYLYWYACYKAKWNPILLSAAIVFSAFFIEYIAGTFLAFDIHTEYVGDMMIFPVIIIVFALLFFIRESFRDPRKSKRKKEQYDEKWF